MTSNPPQIATIHVHLNGSLAHTLWVALCFRFRCVLMPTVHTAIPLGTGFCFSGSVLACGFLAIGTFLHIPILAHPFGHSPQLLYLDVQNICAILLTYTLFDT